MKPDESVNALGGTLRPCSSDPLTGYFRDGHCNTCATDAGSHTVCAVMTAEFLAFSKYVGNDLSTPRPEFGFAGLGAYAASRWDRISGWAGGLESRFEARAETRRQKRRRRKIRKRRTAAGG